jgi:hypothetical protein
LSWAAGRRRAAGRAGCAAAVALVTESRQSTPSLGIRLLTDLRQVFGDREVMATVNVLEALAALDEAPWGDLRGKPLDARGLANYLRQYEVNSTTVRDGDLRGKGYKREDLWDAWSRYLPTPPQESVTSVTSVTDDVPVTDVTDVTAPTEANPECRRCGQRLLLIREGRDVCARCEATPPEE